MIDSYTNQNVKLHETSVSVAEIISYTKYIAIVLHMNKYIYAE